MVCDNGFSTAVDFDPANHLDQELAYSHRVHFQLDVISFTVGFNLAPLFHGRRSH